MSSRPSRPKLSLATLLLQSEAAEERGDRAEALRQIDRAYRVYPDAWTSIVRPYALLLARDGHDDRAALAMLDRVVALGTDEALETCYLAVVARSGTRADRLHALSRAVARLALRADGPWARAACDLLRHEPTLAAGLLLLGPDFTLAGWAREAGVWQVRVDGRAIDIPKPDADGFWRIRLAPAAYRARIEATVDGRGVIGHAAQRPAHGGLVVTTHVDGDCLTVRAQSTWDPAYVPTLTLRVPARRVVRPSSADVPTASSGFSTWEYRAQRTDGDDRVPWTGTLSTPDGVACPPPENPWLWPRAARADRAAPKGRAPRRPPARAPRAILVPIYAGRAETQACLQALARTCPPGTRVLVIDDATPDEALAQWVRQWAHENGAQWLRHDRNQGFVAAVNTGLAACRGHDVVLLNADTVVHGDWLGRLTDAAYARGNHGTVTPWSGDGTVVSYPVSGESPTGPTGAALDALVAQTFPRETVRLPVGVGFCLYLRHDCLASVGTLSAAVFGVGYGEETDFCLRAAAAGYRSVLAADVYVEHRGGRSFGARRAALQARAQRLVEYRHPGYAARVAAYLARDPLGAWRRRLDEVQLQTHSARWVLLVSHALGGGVERFAEARQRALQLAGYSVLLLSPDGRDEQHRVRVRAPGLALESLVYDTRTEASALTQLLRALSLDRVELQHVLNLPFSVIDSLFELGVPVDVQLHDYVYLCPQVTLMSPEGRYCGERGLADCRRCVAAQRTVLTPALGAAALRRRTGVWLRRARQIVAPSADTAERYRRYWPALDIRVVPHAPLRTAPRLPMRSTTRARTRIALLGGIGVHKGYRVLRDCARYAAAHDLPLEFVVIGYTHDDATLLATDRVAITGPYGEDELGPLLAREQPDAVFLASVWPETWSYTLDAALDTGRPIVAFDIGAIARRLSQSKTGNLLPLQANTADICTALLAAGTSARMPTDSFSTGVARMAPVDPNALTSTVQVLPLPAGVYLFSVQAGDGAPTATSSPLPLPALHVGVGPGVASADVEVMGRQSDSTGWLVRSGDFLVLRLLAAQTPVLVTSLQDPSGRALTVRAERLDARFDEVSVAPAVTARREASVGLPLEVAAHIRNKGNVVYTREAWAGRVEPGLWVESFSIQPLEGLMASELEYKSLTSSGFETPWISDNKLCGTQGMGVPLIGFAVRLKPGARASGYDIEYTGYFASGTLVGPLKNGVPCRSTVANDPLEGLQIRVLPRGHAPSVGITAVAAPSKGRRGPGRAAAPAATSRRGAAAKSRKSKTAKATKATKATAANGKTAKRKAAAQRGAGKTKSTAETRAPRATATGAKRGRPPASKGSSVTKTPGRRPRAVTASAPAPTTPARAALRRVATRLTTEDSAANVAPTAPATT